MISYCFFMNRNREDCLVSLVCMGDEVTVAVAMVAAAAVEEGV